MARLDDVLAHNIGGYLAWDLDSMSRDDTNGRGVGYPLIMAASAGIEFLGALTSPQAFRSRGQSQANFERYWNVYLYPAPSANAPFGKLVYELARCGIAHGFLLKGELCVLRHAPALHLKRDANGSFVIDAVQLAVDFLESYRVRMKPMLTDARWTAERARMEARLVEMERAYATEGATHTAAVAGAQQVLIATVVAAAPAVTPFASGALPSVSRSGPSTPGASGAV